MSNTAPDTEADEESLTFDNDPSYYSLKRQLKNRHIFMIR